MTNFAYNCRSIKVKDDMETKDKTGIGYADILYVNKLTNTCYKNGEILETNIVLNKKDKTAKEAIFDIFARMLTKNGEQRKVLYHIMFDAYLYNSSTLSTKLSYTYGKSERSYRRAIEYLLNKKVIQIKDKKFVVNIDYNLALLDLDEVKSIIIHLN